MKYFLFTILTLTFINKLSVAQQNSLFPEIDSWKQSEEQVYTPGTLYNAINGGSELYLKYSFIDMRRVEYSLGENYITVEVYKHLSPIHAYGVYSREKPNKDVYFEIGVEGYQDHDYIHFNAGQYYIKIRSYNPDEASLKAMYSIAERQAGLLNNNATFPSVYAAFPGNGKIPYSEKFYSESILGYKFLKNSYEVDYSKGKKEYILFVLEGTDETDSKQMLLEYFNSVKIDEEITDGKLYTVEDRYNGTIQVIKKGKYLVCSRGDVSQKASEKILVAMADKL